MRQDLLISVLVHLALAALLIILNPTQGRFSGVPEVITVKLGGDFSAGENQAPAVEEEPEAVEIAPPQPLEPAGDELIEESFELKSRDVLEEIEKTKEKPKKKPPRRKPVQEKRPEPKPQQQEKPTQESSVPTGSAGPGIAGTIDAGAGGVAGEGGGDSNLPYNLGMLIRKLEQAWNNPVQSSSKMICTIYFQIDRHGNLIGTPVVEKSSGNRAFDQSAVYAVMRVDRFPEFPPTFDQDYIGLHLDFWEQQ